MSSFHPTRRNNRVMFRQLLSPGRQAKELLRVWALLALNYQATMTSPYRQPIFNRTHEMHLSLPISIDHLLNLATLSSLCWGLVNSDVCAQCGSAVSDIRILPFYLPTLIHVLSYGRVLDVLFRYGIVWYVQLFSPFFFTRSVSPFFSFLMTRETCCLALLSFALLQKVLRLTRNHNVASGLCQA